MRAVAKGLPKQPKNGGHFSAMPYPELPAYMSELRKHGESVGRAALEFTILTAARSGETRGATWEEIDLEKRLQQRVQLTPTTTTFGGLRWWMNCPVSGRRVAKLYKPPGGANFAARPVWKLGYQSQRISAGDRPFEQLFRLQRKLGSYEGWDAGLGRPKGMWSRTYERHVDRYLQLDAECSIQMNSFMKEL